ncbi:hypothetical protein CTI14_71150, partial [Methylobacterium radiotolerans]
DLFTPLCAAQRIGILPAQGREDDAALHARPLLGFDAVVVDLFTPLCAAQRIGILPAQGREDDAALHARPLL